MISSLKGFLGNNEKNTQDQALIDAVKANDYEAASKALSLGANPDAVDQDTNCCALVISHKNNNMKIGYLLVSEYNANRDELLLFNERNRALITAIKNNDLSGAREALSRGAYINSTDLDDRSGLMIAAAKGFNECLKLLIENGADINYQRNAVKDTALIVACHCNHYNLQGVKILLENGANTELKNYDGKTALSVAVDLIGFPNKNINKDIVDALLEHHADINAQNHYGYTAFMTITSNVSKYKGRSTFSFDDLKRYIAMGGDLDLKTEDGCSALDMARSDAELYGEKEQVEIYNYLLNCHESKVLSETIKETNQCDPSVRF